MTGVPRKIIREALQLEASIQLAFTKEVLECAARNHVDISKKEAVILGEKMRNRLRTETPDDYVQFIARVEREFYEQPKV